MSSKSKMKVATIYKPVRLIEGGGPCLISDINTPLYEWSNFSSYR